MISRINTKYGGMHIVEVLLSNKCVEVTSLAITRFFYLKIYIYIYTKLVLESTEHKSEEMAWTVEEVKYNYC